MRPRQLGPGDWLFIAVLFFAGVVVVLALFGWMIVDTIGW